LKYTILHNFETNLIVVVPVVSVGKYWWIFSEIF